MIARRQ